MGHVKHIYLYVDNTSVLDNAFDPGTSPGQENAMCSTITHAKRVTKERVLKDWKDDWKQSPDRRIRSREPVTTQLETA